MIYISFTPVYIHWLQLNYSGFTFGIYTLCLRLNHPFVILYIGSAQDKSGQCRNGPEFLGFVSEEGSLDELLIVLQTILGDVLNQL